MVLYIDCKQGKTLIDELIVLHEITGEAKKSLRTLKEEVIIDVIEDEFENLFIKYNLCKDERMYY